MSVKALKAPGFSLLALAAVLLPAPCAQAQTLHVLRPIDNAIVRETVPVRIAPGDLPADGYVGISIDGQFRTARVLPTSKREPVYDWDTKASYTSADDPNTQKFVADGPHTLTVKLYDTSGKSLGEKTISLRVANKISVPAQGIKLAYRWPADLQQRYTRRTEIDSVGDSGTSTDQTLQTSILRFSRTVEDTTGGGYLIRDRILPGGVLINHGQAELIDALYSIKSKYRTVNSRGDVIGTMAPLSAGDHFGFSIPVLSARRVAVGDTWQAPVSVSLDWASIKPATVTAESRLEGFEWQSGYPTAKIRESYSGPVIFTPISSAAGGQPGMIPAGGAAGFGDGSITLPSVNYERIVYFAYNSGRLVRTETTVTLTTANAQLASLGLSGVSTAGAAPYGPPGGNFPGPNQQGGPPQIDPGGGPPAGLIQGNYPPAGVIPGNYPPPGGGYPPPGGGYPGGGPPQSYPGQAAQQSTTTNLKVTDITSQS